MKKRYKILLGIAGIIIMGLLIPYDFHNPVEGGTRSDYNRQSYWYYPWGTSVTHKGVDIFKKRGTNVRPAASIEWVLFVGFMPGKGGNAVITLAPGWRLHYYAHLDEVKTKPLSIVGHNTVIGTVGNSGNAASTPSHLHFGIMSMIPDPFAIDASPHGFWKMFYRNPIDHLNKYHATN